MPQELVERAKLAVTPAYGAELNRLARDGVTLLSPRDTLGLIAFPSFHTVMACLSVWFMARSALLFIPMVLLNILMVPAIIIHGGHHLVDVFGGVLTFALAFALSGVLLRSLGPRGDNSGFGIGTHGSLAICTASVALHHPCARFLRTGKGAAAGDGSNTAIETC